MKAVAIFWENVPDSEFLIQIIFYTQSIKN